MATKTADTISATAQAPQTGNGIFTDTISDLSQAPETETVSNIPKSMLKPVKRDSRIFMLSNDKRQGNVIIDLEEVVYDPATKKRRAMRIVRRAPSIWLDEQPASTFTAEMVRRNVLAVTFNRGRATIPVHEEHILQAMELSNRNLSNPNRTGIKDIYYTEWNPTVENAKAIKEEDEVMQAMKLAFEAKESEMIQHASYLNIPFVDEQGVPFDEAALRAAYTRFAKNNAKKFLTSIQSPTVKVAYTIRKAQDNGKLDLGLQPGAAYWQDGGFITAIPEGRDAVEYLIEFAMTHGEANQRFADQLKALG